MCRENVKGAPLLFSGASSFLGGKIPAPSQERYDSALAPLFSALVAAAQGSQLKQINYPAPSGSVFCSQPYV